MMVWESSERASEIPILVMSFSPFEELSPLSALKAIRIFSYFFMTSCYRYVCECYCNIKSHLTHRFR